LGVSPILQSSPPGQFNKGGSGDSMMPYSSVNVSLLSEMDLTTFGASNGNDIWGYVSPSGREYALVGLSNKVAFVEVTNPTNPVYFANIAHLSSQWADLETYQNYLYVVTEATGSGIQVINLANIDSHQVSLVRTIASPGRTHTLSIDQDSGFLYTNGSRNGTGTTMCFSLANPSNPVQVGANTMTSVYQHDSRPITFTDGPYAGRQILFGSGESRGVEIWDVTNKNAPFLVVRRSYPQVGYCHQSWLDKDRKYMYVNDELDENNFGVLTRTLVFDVSDITNPILVNTFTTGLPTIDHNLYWYKGFVFESNYTSGVRIFNTNVNPTAPPEVGWFDTRPENNNVSFNGTWSNYPFLPSGTLLVCDINRGLFVLDPSAATQTPADLDTLQIVRGVQMMGDIESLEAIDGDKLVVRGGGVGISPQPPIEIVLEGTSPWEDVSKLRFVMTSNANTPGLTRKVEAWDWVAGTYETISVTNASIAVEDADILMTNPERFIASVTRSMRVRVTLNQTGPILVNPYSLIIDRAGWMVNP
jgi:choice-of-anchor B domain-containing protein